ncbi:MAG TPA: hypothetical protein VGF80_16095 [Galbitalea sp.]
MSNPKTGGRGGITPLRLVIWVLGAGIGVALIAVGIVGILTKAR